MNKAFTLVELAIVIVIIGLLVGGVLAGQELIQQAKIRSFIKQLESYRAAVIVYTDKYKFLPGDQPDAFRFWGSLTGCTDDMVTSLNAGGCNGNGNGAIEDGGFPFEVYRAWQYLALANLIKGSYTGVTGPLSIRDASSSNTAATPFNNAIFDFRPASATSLSWTNGAPIDNYFNVGVMRQTATGGADLQSAAGPVLSPIDAYSFDSKIDDGMPGSGRVRSKAFQSRCTNGGFDALVNIYDASKTAIGCSFNIQIN